MTFLVVLGCGGRSSENCTYFEAANFGAGSCKATICPCGSNICQLRLDFTSFVITGPSTTSESTAKAQNGAVRSGAVGKSVSQATQCLTDTFTVTTNGVMPPTICGINTGEHSRPSNVTSMESDFFFIFVLVYVDANDNCNMLNFNLGNNGLGTGIATRSWSIKVTQYACGFSNLAPPGCTQYFFGDDHGTVQTFNFAGGSHLANQCQNICVRRERNSCQICWAAAAGIDFELSGDAQFYSYLIVNFVIFSLSKFV